MIHQGKLETAVHQLFPGQRILINARREAQIKNPITGSFLEIDIFLPSLNIGFEFQDTYHYTDTWDSHLPLDYVRKKDKAVRKRYETLILVPCWWDGSTESLAASVSFDRPDLLFDLSHFSQPIPLSPPNSFFKEGKVKGMGELMLASFPTDTNFDITVDNHWWVGEKYDGIRFCYSVDAKQTFTRSSSVLNLPRFILDQFPPICMDGEVWFGRGSFLESQKLVISPSSSYSFESVDWSLLRVVSFDEPSLENRMKEFEIRYELLINNFPIDHPLICEKILAPRIHCTSHFQLAKIIKNILEEQGEGVVLRKPKSLYEPGRSNNLLKLKAMRGDKEALIIEILSDGDLVLQLPDGNIFSTSPENYSSIQTPHVGDIVSFTYENFTRSSIPIKPKIFRIRKDVNWKDIILAHHQDEKYKKETETIKPKGYWKKEKNKRQFLERIARDHLFDPLLAEPWYSFAHQLRYKKGIGGILRQFNGSVIRALVSLFPEVSFHLNKFITPPRDYWKSVVNRREFMKQWAELKGFDPLLPEHWHSFSQKDLLKVKKMSSVLGYYKSHGKALSHLFPEVQGLPSKVYWLDIDNRRLFFDKFAKNHDFDPMLPDPWYSVDPQSILNEHGGKIVLSFYRGSWINALISLFPSIPFDELKFLHYPKNYWRDSRNQRRFFENFAKNNSFNLTSPTPWYSVTLDSILATKDGKEVLSYHKGSFIKALLSLFPEINFQECKFLDLPDEFWAIPQNQKKLFITFAQDHHFDPLSPHAWYNVIPSTIQSYQNAKHVLIYHRRSYILALLALFPDIGLERENFSIVPRHFWKDVDNKRKFFYKIAAENEFDPLVGSHWLNFKKEDITKHKGGISIMHMYKGDIRAAVEDVIPGLSFDTTKNENLNAEQVINLEDNDPEKKGDNQKYNLDDSNTFEPNVPKLVRNVKELEHEGDKRRRGFFVSLAIQKGFDPSSPDHWYHLNESTILSQKGSAKVLSVYKGNFIEALRHSFPELNLDSKKFHYPPQSYWLSQAIKTPNKQLDKA